MYLFYSKQLVKFLTLMFYSKHINKLLIAFLIREVYTNYYSSSPSSQRQAKRIGNSLDERKRILSNQSFFNKS